MNIALKRPRSAAQQLPLTQIGNGEQGKDDIQYGEDQKRHAQEKGSVLL
ncbi:MAG: hypothetical protein ACR5LD_03405 [Symbiopectobacterium sp.]